MSNCGGPKKGCGKSKSSYNKRTKKGTTKSGNKYKVE